MKIFKNVIIGLGIFALLSVIYNIIYYFADFGSLPYNLYVIFCTPVATYSFLSICTQEDRIKKIGGSLIAILSAIQPLWFIYYSIMYYINNFNYGSTLWNDILAANNSLALQSLSIIVSFVVTYLLIFKPKLLD